MQPNLTMLSWTVAFMQTPLHKATLACAGSFGDVALQETLSGKYPNEKTLQIIVTNGGEKETPPSTCSRLLSACEVRALVDVSPKWNTLYNCELDELRKSIAQASSHWQLRNVTLISGTRRSMSGVFRTLSMQNCLSLTVMFPNIEETEEGFLSYCARGFQRLDLSHLVNLKSLPQHFLDGDNTVAQVVLPPLLHHEQLFVPQYFLHKCVKVVGVDLSGFRGVATVKDNFMAGCCALTDIELSPFSSASEIQDYFLWGCSQLRGIDLQPLTNVRCLGHHFLSECHSLASIDLTPLCGIEELPQFFLAECSSLVEVDCSQFLRLTKVGHHFMSECTGLLKIRLPVSLSKLQQFPTFFLSDCVGLESVDLSPLEGVTVLGDGFLAGCAGLKHLSLAPLSSLREIPRYFLRGCERLEGVDMSPLRGLKKVRGYVDLKTNN